MGYPHSLSPKFLSGPTGKEFYGIMDFLFKLVDKNSPFTRNSLPAKSVSKSIFTTSTFISIQESILNEHFFL